MLFTALICVFVACTLFALEAIAGEMSGPFGLAPNNLARDAITRTIERSLSKRADVYLIAVCQKASGSNTVAAHCRNAGTILPLD